MPEVPTIETQAERLQAIQAELKGLTETAKLQDRSLTNDELDKFDKLTKEAEPILVALAQHRRQRVMQDKLDMIGNALKAPKPIGWTPEHPAQDELGVGNPRDERRQALEERLRMGGAHKLRAFPNTVEGRKSAYSAGVLLLASGNNMHREWALQKASDLGVRHYLAPMSEDNNVAGGYLVFPEFEATLIILRELYGVLRRVAAKHVMGSDTMTVPRRVSGTTVYYPQENATVTDSAMNFDQVQLVAKLYAQLTRLSTSLSEDAVISLADTLADEMAYQFAKAEDTNGFIGTGTSTYAGVVGLCSQIRDSKNYGSIYFSGAASTTAITLNQCEALVAQLPLYAEGRAKWFCHKSVFWNGPARLMDAAGGNLAAILSTGAPLRFLGYDVELTQAMYSTVASTSGGATSQPNSIVLTLGDPLSTFHMGVRRGVSVQTSDQRYFEYEQLGVKATERVAINVTVGDPANSTGTGGPMVGLSLASS